MKYRKFLELVEQATGVRPTHSLISKKLGGKPKAGALSNRYFNDGYLSYQELVFLANQFTTVDFSEYLNESIENINKQLNSNELIEIKKTSEPSVDFISSDLYAGKSYRIPYWDGEAAEQIKKPNVDDLCVDVQTIYTDWKTTPESLIFISMPGDEMEGGEYPIRNKDSLIVDTSRTNISESGVFFCTTQGHTRVHVRRIIEVMSGSIKCITTVDNPRYKSFIEKQWTEEKWLAADVQVIGRVIKNESYTI